MKTTLKFKEIRRKEKLDKNDIPIKSKTVKFIGAFTDIDVTLSLTGIESDINKALKKLDIKSMKDSIEIKLSPNRQTLITDHIGGNS